MALGWGRQRRNACDVIPNVLHRSNKHSLPHLLQALDHVRVDLIDRGEAQQPHGGYDLVLHYCGCALEWRLGGCHFTPSWLRSLLTARITPLSPYAAWAKRKGRPRPTPRAPNATALRTSDPRRIPPSIYTSKSFSSCGSCAWIDLRLSKPERALFSHQHSRFLHTCANACDSLIKLSTAL